MDNILDNPFIKATNINAFPSEAWTALTGKSESESSIRELYQAVPYLHRGVEIRAAALSNIPFVILQGDNELDNSASYENRLGWLGSPRRLLWLIETSLVLSGESYLFVERNATRPLNIRHMRADSIKPIIKSDGLVGFRRTLQHGRRMTLEIDDVLYLWPPDDYIEIGPPEHYPALAATIAAGVVKNKDEFVQMFFRRGAIKATLLTTKGNIAEPERRKLKSWWRRMFQGVKKAWETEIVNADSVNPVVVGEGISELSNVDLTNEMREAIATALGVPHSLLFSNSANFATSQQDKRNFYEDTIIPEAEFIAECLNDQLFSPLGLRLQFNPQSLDIFQQDENDRSSAFESYVRAGLPHSLVAEMLGLDLPAGWEYEDLDSNEPEEPEPTNEDITPLFEMAGNDNMQSHLDMWKRKTIKRFKPGKVVPFESDYIPPTIHAAICGALEKAQSKEEIATIFNDPWVGYA